MSKKARIEEGDGRMTPSNAGHSIESVVALYKERGG
ncbi:MAG: hypothetical protein ACJATP_002023 [Candidatus Azotimanducaceae bacterium]|jgi:hypothetical protein